MCDTFSIFSSVTCHQPTKLEYFYMYTVVLGLLVALFVLIYKGDIYASRYLHLSMDHSVSIVLHHPDGDSMKRRD